MLRVSSGDSQGYFTVQVGDPNAFLHYWVLRVAFSGATACVAHVDGQDLYEKFITYTIHLLKSISDTSVDYINISYPVLSVL